MVIATEKRKSVTVTDESWQKYCKLKARLLLEQGLPELTFTEFANLAIHYADPTIHDVFNYRREQKRAK